MIYDFIIIGSGLTAYSALLELVPSKSKILLVDYGIKNPFSQEALKAIDIADVDVSESKRFMGSSFSTESIKEGVVKGLNFSNSYAFGGLSNIWGCSVEEFSDNEFSGWPDIISDIRNAYKNLNKSIQFYSPVDEYSPNDNKLFYFKKIFNNTSDIFSVVKSRLALSDSLCVRCGECLYGCRYDATFTSKHFINKQINSGRIDYIDGIFVDFVSEKKDFSIVSGKDHSGARVNFKSKKILLCAGAVNTAKILLNSFDQIDHVTLRDSQYFILPIITRKSCFNSSKEDSVALSHFVIKQRNIIEDKSIHYQFYFPSKYTYKVIDKKLSFLPFKLPKLLKNKICILQGYLPSSLSGSIKIRKVDSEIEAIEYEKYSNLYLNHALQNLKPIMTKSGLFPIFSSLKIYPTLSSYHFGSSFPMTDKSVSIGQSDLLGRLKGLSNIHILDSSILPEINAGSFTYTVMANAMRIVKVLRSEI